MERILNSSGASKRSTPWFVDAFDGHYLDRYAHRSQEAAAREIPFLTRELAVAPGSAVLDLCCGAGRHSGELARAGLSVTGVDLSAALLRKAHADHRKIDFIRADMRALPFADRTFSGAVNLFTSFGYFDADAENLAALREAARVLRPGAALVLDFFNLTPTVAALIPKSEKTVSGLQITEARRYDPVRKRIEKTTRIAEAGVEREVCESVRAFAPEEFDALFAQANLGIRARFGDMEGAAFNAKTSPRCITVGVKR